MHANDGRSVTSQHSIHNPTVLQHITAQHSTVQHSKDLPTVKPLLTPGHRSGDRLHTNSSDAPVSGTGSSPLATEVEVRRQRALEPALALYDCPAVQHTAPAEATLATRPQQV